MGWRSHIAMWKSRRIGLVPPDTTPTPTITSATGSTTVVITGTNFMAVAPRPDAGTSFVEDVWFGSVRATSFTVDSATQITAVGSWNGTDTLVVNTSGGCAKGGPGTFVCQATFAGLFGAARAHQWDSYDGTTWTDSVSGLNGAVNGSGLPAQATQNAHTYPVFTEVSNDGLVTASNDLLAGLSSWTLYFAFKGSEFYNGIITKPLVFYVEPGGTLHSPTFAFYGYASGDVQGTTVINDDAWHRCVITANSNVCKVYVDGVLEATGAVPTMPSDPTGGVHLGSAPDPIGSCDGGILIVGVATRGVSAAEAGCLDEILSGWIGDTAAPTVSSVSPTSGYELYANALTVNGADFVATPSVTINGVACTSVVFVNSGQLTCNSPALAAGGPYNVVVTNPDTQTGTLAAAYTFAAVFDPATLSPVAAWHDDWNGTTHVRQASGVLGDYVDVDGYSGTAMVRIESIGTNDTGADRASTNEVIIRANYGYWAIYLRYDGVDGYAGISHFDGGAYVNCEHVLPLAEWARVQWRYTNGVGVQFGVNNDWSAAVPANDLDAAALAEVFWVMRMYGSNNTDPTGHTVGRIRDLTLFDYALNDSEFDDMIDDYYVGHYNFPSGLDAPIAGAPFDSALTPNAHTYTASLVTAAAAFTARDGSKLHYFVGKYWLIGGWNTTPDWATDSTNEVWSSVDRITWTLELAHDGAPPTMGAGARFYPRHTFGSCVMGGYLWVVGGDLALGVSGGGTAAGPWGPNDVWRSADGVTWTRVQDLVPWNDNALHIVTAFNDEIHTFGGVCSVGSLMRLEHWKSADGITWTRMPDPPFTRYAVQNGVVLEDKLIVISGARGLFATPTMDTSTWAYDGLTWALQSSSAGWTGRYWVGVAAYDSKLWLLTGRDFGVAELADLWSSEDLGQTWDAFGAVPWVGSHADGIDANETDGITMASGFLQGINVFKLLKD
jgi:hypothetical protein